MLEIIENNSKYITLKMPLALSRSIFGDVKTIREMSKKSIKFATPSEEEKVILDKKISTKDLSPIKNLFAKYNYTN
jgi:hypothetical protein